MSSWTLVALLAFALGAAGCDDLDAGHDDAWDLDAGDAHVSPDADATDAPDTDATDADALDGTDGDAAPGDVCVACLDNSVWDIRVSDEDWARLLEDVHADVRVPVEVVVDGLIYDAELELHGGSSRVYDKRNLKLLFDDDDPMLRDPFELGEDWLYDKLILKASYKDQSFIRESVAWDLLRALGYAAPRTNWINVTLNGDYHGLFVLTEPIDRDFMRRRDVADDGNLYKAVDQRATLEPGSDWRRGFEKKTNEDEGWDDLEAYIALLQTFPTTEAGVYETLGAVTSIDALLDRHIWISFTQNIDTRRHNFYFYNTGDADAPSWVTYAWDSDVCLSQHWRATRDVYDPTWSHMLDGGTFVGGRLMSVDAVRHAYVDRFIDALDGVYASAVVRDVVDALYARVANDAAVDLAFWSRDSTPDAELAELEAFVEVRESFLREQLELFRDDPATPDHRE